MHCVGINYYFSNLCFNLLPPVRYSSYYVKRFRHRITIDRFYFCAYGSGGEPMARVSEMVNW